MITKGSSFQLLPEEIVSGLPVVTVKRNTVFIPLDKQEKIRLYYILEGEVECFSIAFNGRRFVVDRSQAGDFVGKFSQMRSKDFKCGVRALSDLKLIDFTEKAQELFSRYPDFHIAFLKETSDRVYGMYKIALLNSQFSYEEILAYWLLKKQNHQHVVTNMDDAFRHMFISERHEYNLLKSFRKKGLIDSTRGRRNIKLSDPEALRDLAWNIFTFMDE